MTIWSCKYKLSIKLRIVTSVLRIMTEIPKLKLVQSGTKNNRKIEFFKACRKIKINRVN
jgi:hypothetical protein